MSASLAKDNNVVSLFQSVSPDRKELIFSQVALVHKTTKSAKVAIKNIEMLLGALSEEEKRYATAEFFNFINHIYEEVVDGEFPKEAAAESSPAKELKKVIDMLLTELKDKFIVYRDKKGQPAFFRQLGEQVVAACSIEAIAAEITHIYLGNGNGIKSKDALELAKTWAKAETRFLSEMPKGVRFKSESGYTFHRLDFDPGKDTSCPTFKSFLERTYNADALAAFIFSLFVDQASLQQYIYLKGSGNDGKGSLMRFLKKLLADSATPLSEKKEEIPVSIVGKRLGYLADLKNPMIVMSGIMKTITGGDEIIVNQKYEPIFSFKPTTKIINISNYRAEITSQNSDRRRIIYCEVSPITGNYFVDDYELMLWEERAQIIAYCKAKYEELVTVSAKGTHSDIKCDMKIVDEELSADTESPLHSLFKRNFVADPEAMTSQEEVSELISKELKEMRTTLSEFIEFIERKYNAKGNYRPDGGKRFVKGIRLLTWNERSELMMIK